MSRPPVAGSSGSGRVGVTRPGDRASASSSGAMPPPSTPFAGSSRSAGPSQRQLQDQQAQASRPPPRSALRPISEKQLDRMQRNLVHVERVTRDATGSGSGSGSAGRTEQGAIDGAMQPSSEAEAEGVRIEHEFELTTREDHFLRRPTPHSLIERMIGAGPQEQARKYAVAALAMSRGGSKASAQAAPGAAGGHAGDETFLHEASVVLNPLARRTIAASPRRAPPKRAAGDPREDPKGKARARDAPSRANGCVIAEEDENQESRSARSAPADKGKGRAQAERGSASAPSAAPGTASGPGGAEAEDADFDTPVLPMSGLDKETQEALLVEDLLFVLQGIEGDYIRYAASYDPARVTHQLRGPAFELSAADAPHIDASLRDMVARVLPLATLYAAIDAFAGLQSELAFGTVAHALCSAIRDLLKEYEILLVQLEHQYNTSPIFTLQKLWFYVHPTLRTLSLVHTLTADIAAISYANLFAAEEAESDEEDDSDDADSSGEGSEMGSRRKKRAGAEDEDASLERQRRALLGLDDPDDEAVEGGVVKGGEILAMLWDRVTRMSGDPAAHALYLSLFRAASQPYKATLLRWISTGQLSDPYEEFIVMEDTRVTQASLESDPTDEYWESRYTLRDETILAAREQLKQQGLLAFDEDEEDEAAGAAAGAAEGGDANARGILTGGAKVPAFLEPWKQKILLAGKYLNVIRECGIDINRAPDGSELSQGQDWLLSGRADSDNTLVLHDPEFLKCIEKAYERANTRLLKLLIDEQHIVQRLRSVKHYFVMEHSDFFMSFYEQSIRDLRKLIAPGRVGSIPTRLGQQLGMVLGSSTTVGSNDPYKEDLRVECNTEKVYSQLMRIAETKGGIEAAKALARQKEKDKAVQQFKVMDVLQFDIAVKFPVSLVISKKNILRWQFLQRVLLHLKILERQLVEMWSEHQESAWRTIVKGHRPLQLWKNRIFKLRHSMTFVVQQVLAFITNEIIEPGWDELEHKMANARTVDQFMRDHFDFLNTARKQAMLTDFKYLTFHTRMTTVVEYFVDLRANFRDQLSKEKAAFEGLAAGEQPAIDPGVMRFVDQVEAAWMKQSKSFRDCVILLSTTENPAATPLAHKLQAATLF